VISILPHRKRLLALNGMRNGDCCPNSPRRNQSGIRFLCVCSGRNKIKALLKSTPGAATAARNSSFACANQLGGAASFRAADPT
jgi:hypothetical protein